MPVLMKKFCNLLWVNFPDNWSLKTLFHQETLFVSVIIAEDGAINKIRRQYKYKMIHDREKDLWGLSEDCADEIKNSVLKAD